MRLKLITYNIWHGKYLEKVIDFLREEKADVTCVQEIAQKGRGFSLSDENIFQKIEAALKMRGLYREMFWGDVGVGKFDNGVATFSRFNAMDEVDFRYERDWTNEALEVAVDGKDRYSIPRVLLGAKLKLGRQDLWIFTTHHTITPNGGVTEHQLAATRQLKGFLEKYDRYILCGDMNTPYGNRNYELLSKGLTDLSNPKEPTLHPKIHAVGNLGYHVDYVFAKGTGIKHLSTRIPVIDASDHLPVIVEIEVND